MHSQYCPAAFISFFCFSCIHRSTHNMKKHEETGSKAGNRWKRKPRDSFPHTPYPSSETQRTNLVELWAMHAVWERFFPGSDTGCTFGEYIRKKWQKSSILQEDSCRNTALNKEKRNFRKKIQFVPPFSHSKRGTKRRFSHIYSFETCKYTDSTEFRRKWMPKSKKFHIVPHYLEQPFQAKYDSP